MQPHSVADARRRRRILVADEDLTVVEFVIKSLREEGHAVFHAFDGRAATELAFAIEDVDLIITNTKVNGLAGVDLVRLVRAELPDLPMIYMANAGRSTPEIEAQLPSNIPILREPFTAEELKALVRTQLGDGAGPAGEGS